MAAQRQTVTGQGAKKRRKYIHFDELLFLVPFTKGRETSSNVSRCENEEEQDDSQGACPQHDTSTNSRTATPALPRKNKKANVTSFEASLLNILEAKQSDDVNEDKHFAMMLVPMLGQLNYEQKHYAKVEILNVMRNARYYNQPQPAFPQSFLQGQPAPSHNACGRPVYHHQNVHSQNSTSLQHFYNDFSATLTSPSSASGSDLFDLSHQ